MIYYYCSCPTCGGVGAGAGATPLRACARTRASACAQAHACADGRLGRARSQSAWRNRARARATERKCVPARVVLLRRCQPNRGLPLCAAGRRASGLEMGGEPAAKGQSRAVATAAASAVGKGDVMFLIFFSFYHLPQLLRWRFPVNSIRRDHSMACRAVHAARPCPSAGAGVCRIAQSRNRRMRERVLKPRAPCAHCARARARCARECCVLRRAFAPKSEKANKRTPLRTDARTRTCASRNRCSRPARDDRYAARNGDTLQWIAALYGTNWIQALRARC